MQWRIFQPVPYLSPTSYASSFTHTTRQTERRERLFMYAFIISRRTVGQALHCYFCSPRLKDMELGRPCIGIGAPGSQNPARRGTSIYKRFSVPSFWKEKTSQFQFRAEGLATRSIATQASPFRPKHLLCIFSLMARTSDKIIWKRVHLALNIHIWISQS